MRSFGLPSEQTATVCASILAMVGLLVLFQTCKPFGTFRKVIWGTMATALVVCFTLLGGFFELRLAGGRMVLLLVVLLLVIPTVYRFVDWLCEQSVRLWAVGKEWMRGRFPDLFED
jgi:cation-transporting ATPase E